MIRADPGIAIATIRQRLADEYGTIAAYYSTRCPEHSTNSTNSTKEDQEIVATSTIGDFLLRRIREAGVTHLFGVPGDFKPRIHPADRGRRRAHLGRRL